MINCYLVFLATTLASYGIVEMFCMAVKVNRERRPFVILQIASGFVFCLWVLIDKTLISGPVIFALFLIASDRLQTRLTVAKAAK